MDNFLCVFAVICLFLQVYAASDNSCISADGENLKNNLEYFDCGNEICLEIGWLCDGIYDCENMRDEANCGDATSKTESCTEGYLCPTNNTCIPKSDICNGVSDCFDGSDERACDVTKVAVLTSEKRRCEQWFLDKRSNSSFFKWGPQVHRTAVALYLADVKLFYPGNKIGDEIRYEITIQLLSILNKQDILRTDQLAMYVHAMVVSCLNPHDFRGHDLVSELRKRVNLSKYTNPFAVLVLCNAGANMTSDDIERLNATFAMQPRSYWTEIQIISTMALSCISSKTDVSVDQEVLQEWVDSAKVVPLKNGTATNPRTIALVIQMMLGSNYSVGFNWQAAIQAIQDPSFLTSSNFLDKYYLTPVLNNKGLTSIDNHHCAKLSYNVDLFARMKQQMHTVRYTVWMDKEVDFGRSWRLKMNSSSTLYDVIQTVQRQDSTHTVKYNMVDGKPFVKSVSGVAEDPETDHYWFTYERTHGSDEDPKLLKDSPVDISTRENQELILWYRNGVWNSDSYDSEQSP